MSQHTPVTKDDIIQLYREAVVLGVPMEEVQRKIQRLSEVVESVAQKRTQKIRVIKKKKRQRKILPIVLVTLGSILLANAVWPILSYAVFVSPQLQRSELKSPIPSALEVKYSSTALSLLPQVTPNQAQSSQTRITPVMLREELDYTNLSNWFSAAPVVAREQEELYSLRIPSLNIEDASVKVGGTDLNENLIQYPGTAEPGQIGAPVIFGHSVLRQFYRPETANPNRYKSLFSKIMTLKSGEKIYITHQGVEYTYEVIEKHEVQPEDLFILQQRHDAKQLKLVTCVPEGTYLRRGVIVAQLVGVK